MDVTVAKGKVGSPAFLLTAGQVSTVTFAEDLDSVEVYSDGLAPVWWTCDGTTPAEGNGYFIPLAAIDERRPVLTEDHDPSRVVVRLWSAGAPTVRVQRG